MTPNPIFVETIRGQIVENRHRGAIAVVGPSGKSILSIGDIERAVFPRSSIKSIIALPFVESGAADGFGFGQKELAFICSSHSGEAAHRALTEEMLMRVGLSLDALECGPTWPYIEQNPTGPRAYAASGRLPERVCHNCSGKHAGLICTARHNGIDHQGYLSPDHILQKDVRQTLEDVTGARHEAAYRGIDGCSIPNYAIPLKNLALGMARMMTGEGLSDGLNEGISERRKDAAQRLVNACMAEPFYVAGTGRACTAFMEAAQGEIFAKYGADGVYALGLPKLGLGIALKCDDGTPRAAEAMAAGILRHLLPADHKAQTPLSAWTDKPIYSANGEQNGTLNFKPETLLGN